MGMSGTIGTSVEAIAGARRARAPTDCLYVFALLLVLQFTRKILLVNYLFPHTCFAQCSRLKCNSDKQFTGFQLEIYFVRL